MRGRKLALAFLIAVSLGVSGAASAASVCERAYDQLAEQPQWLEQLYNPVLITRDEVAQRRALLVTVARCLDEEPGSLPPPIATHTDSVRRLAQRFVEFTDDTHLIDVGSAPYATRALADGAFRSRSGSLFVSLSELRDPALDRFQAIGLPLPPGLVFFRFYGTLGEMPPSLRGHFSSGDVRAAVFNSRFVAVLMPDTSTDAAFRLHYQTLPTTISHELVHVAINATLGSQSDRLEPWFHEGAAIHFSGSNELAVGTGQSGTSVQIASQRAPMRYKEYGDNFQYLEMQLGPEAFHKALREAILARSTRPLLTAAALDSYPQLMQRGRDLSAAKAPWTLLYRAAAGVGQLAFGVVVLLILVVLGKAAAYLLSDVLNGGLRTPRARRTSSGRRLSAPAPSSSASPAVAPSAATPAELRDALVAFAGARTLTEARRLVEATPSVLSQHAASALARAAERAPTPRSRNAYRRAYVLVTRSLAVGVDQAFAEAAAKLPIRAAFWSALQRYCGRSIVLLRGRNRAACQALADEVEGFASDSLPEAGARPFLALLAAWLRGEDATVHVAELDERYQQVYARMAELVAREEPIMAARNQGGQPATFREGGDNGALGAGGAASG
jgi:hypothetical protein